MSKFIPKLRELSSRFYGSGSAAPKLKPEHNAETEASTETISPPENGTATATVEATPPPEAISPEERFASAATATVEAPVSEANAIAATAPAPATTENGTELATDSETATPTDAPPAKKGLLPPIKFPQPLVKLVTNPVSKEIIGLVFSRKPMFLRWWFWLSLGVGGSVYGAMSVWVYVEKQLPESTVDVLTYVRDSTLTIKAADGSILQQQGEATREKLRIKQIPNNVISAFIAIEDRRFYQHTGVDYQGILRALISNLQAREVVEGGSTLTQQLARVVFLDQERSVWRKVKEFRLAQKIEESLDKEQILERYLNLVYLGSGAYGVADAAWVYFSKTVDQLTLSEAATLAGLPPAPSKYSPFENKDAALKRRNVVLQEMREAGYITPEQAKKAMAEPLNVKPSQPKRLNRAAPYFTEYIQQELPKYISPEVIERGGLTIETSLNPKWQAAAEKAVQNAVKENGEGQNFSQAALVAIDPRTGQVKAMVGGKEFFRHQFNRVTQAMRQPGSTFKMFVYTTAIAGGFSPYRGYEDAPLIVDGYTPKNFSSKFSGWMDIRSALRNSVNIIAVKTLIDVGWDPVIEVAKKMGIESPLYPGYSLALGGSEVNLLELTGAYGTLATQGNHVKPHGIRRIYDRRGNIIYQENFKPERAIDKDTAAIMTWMLQAVVNEGTGRSAALDDRPVAGKTGTSDEARDLWFIGYIPQLVAGVWLGNDNNKPTWGASSTAAYTWHQFMVKAIEGMPVEKFPRLPSLEDRKPTIKLKPIKPKKITTGSIGETEKPAVSENTYRRSRQREDSDSTPTVNYRRRSQESESAPVQRSQPASDPPVRYRRRQVEESAPPPVRRRSAPAASGNSQPSQPPSNRVSEPPPLPAPEPPAGH